MTRFRVAPASRRQLLRKSLVIGVGLAVARITRAIAAPAPVIQLGVRHALKVGEEDQLMPVIMHLIKVGAAQDKVYRAVGTAEGIRNWWTRDAALDPKVGGAGAFGFYGHRFAIKVKVAELTSPVHVVRERSPRSAAVSTAPPSVLI